MLAYCGEPPEESWTAEELREDSIHLGQAYAFLSLDLVAPAWSSLDVPVAHDVLQAPLRETIVDYRQLDPNGPEAGRVRAFASPRLRATADERWGPLSDWCDTVFSTHDANLPHWNGWSQAFGAWTRRSRRHPAELVLPAARFRSVHDHYMEMLDRRDVDNAMQATRETPLSDWDAETCVRLRWNPYDPLRDPFGLVDRVVAMARFQRFATWLVLQLEPAQQVDLWRSVVAVLAERGFAIGDDLAPLDDLVAHRPVAS